MVPNARFTEFLADIEPSATTKSNSATAHDDVRAFLQTHETFGPLWVHDFLAGSYARDTALRPRTVDGEVERADIDVCVETLHERSDRPYDVLEHLCDVLAEEFSLERMNKRSARIWMAKADVDVVPLIADGDAYLIPCRDLDDWKPTNPPGHKTWSTDQNRLFGGRFKPEVKILKWWRRENPTGKRPKGFVLEVLVAKHAPLAETHYGEAFAATLENIYAAYSALAAIDLMPNIDDPSLPGNDILSKVTLPQWKAFLEKCRVYGDIARRAQDTDDMEEATRLWRRVFGDRFPKTQSIAKAAILGAAFAAPASSGYTFPDAPAAPPRPRGFA
jgi:hypothetical protein